MPLSRLDNFLKNARGNILYVNPNDLDATDSIENQGNSLARPFKTIQRALIEAARFSYQTGLDNDRFSKTTILLYPGEHIVDNRPGWIPDGSGNFRLRNGLTSSDFPSFSLTSNFDLTTANNALYKLNSVHGGVILPRGTSIVGLDLRKTKIRPKYVPDPTNDNIERTAIFRVTGTTYMWQFSIFDGDPNGSVYKDYTDNKFVPNESSCLLISSLLEAESPTTATRAAIPKAIPRPDKTARSGRWRIPSSATRNESPEANLATGMGLSGRELSICELILKHVRQTLFVHRAVAPGGETEKPTQDRA